MKVKVLKIIDEKTFKGVATTYKRHPKYGKIVTTHKNFLISYNGQKLEIGQEVEIVASKPISKMKKWALKVN